MLSTYCISQRILAFAEYQFDSCPNRPHDDPRCGPGRSNMSGDDCLRYRLHHINESSKTFVCAHALATYVEV